MATTLYDTFDIQVGDRYSSRAVIAAGGKALVCLTGVYTLATLADPDNDFAALSQPVALVRGRLRFAVARSAGAPVGVDVYGTAPSGHGFQLYNAKAGTPSQVRIDLGNPNSQVVAPFSFATGVVASVVDTGLDFVTGMLVGPYVYADVKVIDATETIDFGLLASESGGDEDGFCALLDVATAGVIRPTWISTTTAGALIKQSQDSAAVFTPRPHVINATAVSLTYTLTSGSDTAAGRLVLPTYVATTG